MANNYSPNNDINIEEDASDTPMYSAMVNAFLVQTEIFDLFQSTEITSCIQAIKYACLNAPNDNVAINEKFSKMMNCVRGCISKDMLSNNGKLIFAIANSIDSYFRDNILFDTVVIKSVLKKLSNHTSIVNSILGEKSKIRSAKKYINLTAEENEALISFFQKENAFIVSASKIAAEVNSQYVDQMSNDLLFFQTHIIPMVIDIYSEFIERKTNRFGIAI